MASTAAITTTKWKVDPAHSEVQFKVRHLMITTVTGYFKKFDLEVETEKEDDFTTFGQAGSTHDIIHGRTRITFGIEKRRCFFNDQLLRLIGFG